MIQALVSRLLKGRTPPSPHSLGDLLGPDGCPTGPPDSVASALLARLDRIPEAADEAAVIGAIDALVHIEGTMGWLPGGSPTTAAMDRSLHRLLCRAADLALPCPPTTEPGTDWTAWAWRSSGAAVAHSVFKAQPGRIWVAPAGVQWDWGHITLLKTEPATGLTLQHARVDAPRFTATQSGLNQMSKTEARKARVTLSRTGISSVRWTVGWAPVATPQGLEAHHGDHTLIGKLDPSWRWQLQGTEVLGEGTGPMRCSFELR